MLLKCSCNRSHISQGCKWKVPLSSWLGQMPVIPVSLPLSLPLPLFPPLSPYISPPLSLSLYLSLSLRLPILPLFGRCDQLTGSSSQCMCVHACVRAHMLNREQQGPNTMQTGTVCGEDTNWGWWRNLCRWEVQILQHRQPYYWCVCSRVRGGWAVAVNFRAECIAKLHRDLWRWLAILAGYILDMHCPSFSWRDCGWDW